MLNYELENYQSNFEEVIRNIRQKDPLNQDLFENLAKNIIDLGFIPFAHLFKYVRGDFNKNSLGSIFKGCTYGKFMWNIASSDFSKDIEYLKKYNTG